MFPGLIAHFTIFFMKVFLQQRGYFPKDLGFPSNAGKKTHLFPKCFFSWWFTMVQPVQNHEINKHNTSSWLKQPMNENSAKVKLDHAPISINFYQFFFELWGTWFERQGFGWGMVSTDSMGVAAFQQRTSRANTKNFSIFLGEKNMFFF